MKLKILFYIVLCALLLLMTSSLIYAIVIMITHGQTQSNSQSQTNSQIEQSTISLPLSAVERTSRIIQSLNSPVLAGASPLAYPEEGLWRNEITRNTHANTYIRIQRINNGLRFTYSPNEQFIDIANYDFIWNTSNGRLENTSNTSRPKYIKLYLMHSDYLVTEGFDNAHYVRA